MAEHSWPLRSALPAGHDPFTKTDLIGFLDHFDDETPIWLDNYRQLRPITQYPIDLMIGAADGIHLA
ncbi:hypothetical protein [Cryobacterium tepidiphilum]|uniref:Uncharacterized protein n=1 Tax=Cryobacterium tepidiphilum TaxID=2486026 RepID=A0A3M8LA34_9MICO|nr:hypothetical protein [Cryobacterium tepidiphilum]RNE62361.1 hypothetical protein EEJ31_08120 [Cryobacterium tepidiphilum]